MSTSMATLCKRFRGVPTGNVSVQLSKRSYIAVLPQQFKVHVCEEFNIFLLLNGDLLTLSDLDTNYDWCMREGFCSRSAYDARATN